MDPQLEPWRAQAWHELKAAGDLSAPEAWRHRYLGRRGLLAGLLQRVGQLSPEERPAYGRRVHALQQELTQAWDGRAEVVRRQELLERARQEKVDVTPPGRQRLLGALTRTTFASCENSGRPLDTRGGSLLPRCRRLPVQAQRR